MIVPERLQRRPRYGDYPVPYLVMVCDGKPDFRVTDMPKWHEVVEKRLCSLCGEPNEHWLYFIGGELPIRSRMFFDPPTHQECALYALKVCPYLAAGRERDYRPVQLETKIERNDQVQQLERPDRFGLGRTRGYKVVTYEGKLLLQAHAWAAVTWWKDGVMVA